MTRVIILFMVLTLQVHAVMGKALQGTKKGDLESNLSVLNLFGNKPEKVQQIYRSAYGILSASREATFADVSRNNHLGLHRADYLMRDLFPCWQDLVATVPVYATWDDHDYFANDKAGIPKGKDSWGKCDPHGREEIFKLIEDNHIGGVLLISGDRHGARGFRIPRPSGFELYEFEAGSLGGRHGPPVTRPNWKTQFYGIAGKYAFGEFFIDATLPDPEVTFRLIGDNGTFIHELTLKRSQLTPKAAFRRNQTKCL